MRVFRLCNPRAEGASPAETSLFRREDCLRAEAGQDGNAGDINSHPNETIFSRQKMALT
jgi:hypothetical protein